MWNFAGPRHFHVLVDVASCYLNLSYTEEVAEEELNTYFCSIADKLKRSLSYVPLLDLSKLNDFVQSRKDPGVRFSVPIITS